MVATASRDGQVKVWELQSQPSDLVQVLLHAEHSSFVNAVAIGRLSLGQGEETLCVASGGTEGIIYVWDIVDNKLLGTLIGHTGNICFLRLLNNVIYSCSWDKTIRAWQGFHCFQTLIGHSEAVWSCCPISDEYLLSGSGDKTIRLWKDGSCVRIYKGHTDAVREVISLDDSFEDLGDFASCSNDGTIKFWRLDGECTHSIKAHDSFIYTIKVYRDHLFSAGEDRTLKIWTRSGDRKVECVQAISLPAVSIWTLDCTSTGEVLCGCSDGRIYIFSPHEALDPGSHTVKEFRERSSKFQISKTLADKHEVSKKGDLLRPGSNVGETKLVESNGLTEVYQWDGTKWDKIGDVVEGPAKNDKSLYDGKEYDYVFDVELDEKGPNLKLPFNNGDDPYLAASRFIRENNLSPELADQIVDFIAKNTTVRTIGSGELFNPYLTSESSTKAPNETRYIDANTTGILRKLEEFAAIEGDNELARSMNGLKKALQVGATLPSGSEAVDALTSAAGTWKPERLFPVFDAIRVLQLRSTSLNPEQIRSIAVSSRRATSSSPALLTLGRLIYNLLCDQECYKVLVKMPDNLCALAEACYSAKLKDATLPVKLLTGLIDKLSAQSEKDSEDVIQVALPLLLTRWRVSTDLEELHRLARSVKFSFPFLGARDRKTVLTELELKRASMNLKAETIELIQNIREPTR